MPARAADLLRVMLCVAALHVGQALAGAQQYEVLSASVRASLSKAVSDKPAPDNLLVGQPDGERWLAEMQKRMQKRVPGRFAMEDDTRAFLNTVHYEATRAGLDPHLVLAVIDVESKFRKYAVSKAGARGYMQVMPFWVKEIGQPGNNLFSLRTNLRYGCTILRHYLDIEKGNLSRALGRYNGSLGRNEYPDAVSRAWKTAWQ
jgi:soluble lytic murein transglycosylase-like protein